MDNNANRELWLLKTGDRYDTAPTDLPASGTVNETKETSEGARIRVYDPSVKFISLSNSLNVRTLGGLGVG